MATRSPAKRSAARERGRVVVELTHEEVHALLGHWTRGRYVEARCSARRKLERAMRARKEGE